MPSNVDIKIETQPATKGTDYRIESENQPKHARAYDYPAKCIHQNEHDTAYQLKQPGV